jgi:streptogramin lyase
VRCSLVAILAATPCLPLIAQESRAPSFDPATRKFREIPLPSPDAVPYIIRTDRRSRALWIGNAAADALLRYDPAKGQFEAYPLPSRGALIRHLAIDPRSGAVWVAYGASPGIPARVARVQRR